MTTLDPAWNQTLPLHHYMLQDVLGSLLGVVGFATLLYAPGYLVAFGADLFQFRQERSFTRRSMWAIALSFCIMPISGYLAGRSAGLGALCWLAGACTLFTAGLLWMQRGRLRWSSRGRRDAALVATGWTLMVLLLLIDFQVGRKLYYSVVMADQSYRIAFTDAVVRTGVPPANPLYFAGAPAPMRYYYFWYVLCAAIVKLTHISARQAFIASSVWAGFGLLATVCLYTRYFFRWERRRRWLALALLLVTGADLLPALGQALLQPTLNGDTEWWSVDPIDSWPDSLLWVPHHVAAVLCCLLAFLLIWRLCSPTEPAVIRPWKATLLAALAFASAAGLSIYVAFGFGLMMLAWLLRLWALRDPAKRTATALSFGVAVLSGCLLWPFLHELAEGAAQGASGAQASNFPFTLSVRRMIDSELVTGLPVFSALRDAHPVLLDQGIRLLFLAPGLAMELGVYGAVLAFWLFLKDRKATGMAYPARATAIFFAVCGLVLCMFVSSAVITNNDFGYRAVMLPQFFLLLLTADLLGAWRRRTVPAARWKQRLVYGLAALGCAGTLYWAVLLRVWLPLQASRNGNGYRHSPEDNYQLREAFDELKQTPLPGMVVAFRPIDPTLDRQGAVMVPNEYFQRMLVMNAGRQMLNAEAKCAVHFGGTAAACPAIQQSVQQIYTGPWAADARAAQSFCRKFGVSYLVLSPWDMLWNASTGWPVELPLIAREPRLRIYRCDGKVSVHP